MSYDLYYILGHTYKLTRNIAVDKGGANNMMGLAVDLCIADEESAVRYDPDIKAHVVDAIDVENFTLRLKWEPWKSTQIFPGLGLGEVSFQPDKISINVQLPTRGHLGNLKDQITIYQLPVLHAGALVLHRVQGMTIEDNETLYIAGHRHPSAQSQINVPWYYVALSRLRIEDSLFLSHPIHEEPDWYKLNPYFVIEFTRLTRLAVMTNLRIEQGKQFPNDDVCIQLQLEIDELTAKLAEASREELSQTTSKQAKKRASPKKTPKKTTTSPTKKSRTDHSADQKDPSQRNIDDSNLIYPKPLGIPNLGVTCYFNSAVQAISGIVQVYIIMTKHYTTL
jgi:hypothetical protein